MDRETRCIKCGERIPLPTTPLEAQQAVEIERLKARVRELKFTIGEQQKLIDEYADQAIEDGHY